MKISEFIQELERVKEKEGDLTVCASYSHGYWGSVYSHITEYTMFIDNHAQPDGPKSGKSEKALVISAQ